MRTIILLFMLAAFSTDCFCQVFAGKKLNEIQHLKLLDSSINLLTEPAQVSDVSIATIDSIYYEILLDENNRIKFISTGDKNFATKEGIRVGSSYAELREIPNSHLKIVRYPGWGQVVALKTGWFAVFDFSQEIRSESPVLFFYQRRQHRKGR